MPLLWIPFSGIYINAHFCKGEIKNIGVYTSAESCSMEVNASGVCTIHKTDEVDQKSCCSQLTVFNTLNTNNLPSVAISIPTLFTSIYSLNVSNSYPSCSIDEGFVFNRKPPDYISPSLSLLQVFII